MLNVIFIVCLANAVCCVWVENINRQTSNVADRLRNSPHSVAAATQRELRGEVGRTILFGKCCVRNDIRAGAPGNSNSRGVLPVCESWTISYAQRVGRNSVRSHQGGKLRPANRFRLRPPPRAATTALLIERDQVVYFYFVRPPDRDHSIYGISEALSN